MTARPKAEAARRQFRAPAASPPRSWSPTRFLSTRRPSTPRSWTRRAPRPAPSAAIPTSRGSSGRGSSRLVRLQAQLIDKAIALTQPGGAIVYCVCSLEPEEGEAQITAVLRRNPDVRRLPIAAEEIGGLADA